MSDHPIRESSDSSAAFNWLDDHLGLVFLGMIVLVGIISYLTTLAG
jgi:hypothetical protein